MSEEQTVETPVEATPVVEVATFTNIIVEKIANGFVTRVAGNQEITAFLTKADLMSFLDITIPEV